jgi:hypothetical protein
MANSLLPDLGKSFQAVGKAVAKSSPKPAAGTPKLAGPPLAGKLGAPGAKVPVPSKGTKIAVKTTSKGSTGKVANPFAGIPKPFAGAPRLAQAYKQTKPSPSSSGSGHSLFSLHTLESGAQDAESGIKSALASTYGSKGAHGQGEGKIATAAPGAALAGTIQSTPLAEGLGRGVLHIPGSAVRTIAGFVPGALETGKAVYEAALKERSVIPGQPNHLEQIGKAMLGQAEHPLKTFEKEPVPVALMISGGVSGIGTAAGDLTRSGALGEKAAALADTTRPALKLYNEEAIPREYSRDVIRKGGQVAADKFREKVLNDPDVNQATGTRLNRHIYGGGLLGQALGHSFQGFFKPGLVDKAQGAFTDIRKMYTNAAHHVMRNIKAPLPKGAEEAVPLAAELTIRTAKTAGVDLEKRLASLRDAAQGLTGKEAKLNGAQQDQIMKLLANKQFMANPEPVIKAADEFAAHQQPLTERKVQLGILEPDQMHAKYVPYATQHMGAEYNLNPGEHPLVGGVGQLTRQAEKARQDVKTSQARLEANRTAGNPTTPHEADLSDKHAALADRRGELLKAKQNLSDLKAVGAIKNSGDMYPRLELDGNPLTTDEIQAHIRENVGDREPAFLTHKEQSWGQATHARSGMRPAIESRSRTGESYRTGTYNASWDALHGQAYKDAQQIAGHETRDNMIRRFGMGSYKDKEIAEKAADNFNHSPGGKEQAGALGPVQVVSAGPDRLLNRAAMPSSVTSDTLRQFGLAEHKAISELGPEGKWRLMPEQVIDRINQHDALGNRSQGRRLMQGLTNKWRSTALYTNPHWPVGIAQENMIRLAFAGINPFAVFGVGKATGLGGDLADHFRTIASDPAATEAQRFAAKAQVAGLDSGHQFGSLINNSVHQELGTIPEGKVAEAMNAFNNSTPMSQMIKGWNGWKDLIGKGLQSMGANTRKAMLGKVALNETRKFSSEWKQLITRQDHAVKAYAEGKLAPSTSAKLGDDIFKMAGNWSQLTPAVRNMVQTYAPFALWHLNSMKFIFKTLPVDHPFKTAALASMAAATRSLEKPGTEPKPEYLEGGLGLKLPIVGNITAEVSKYSPFGVGVEPLTTAANIYALPQLASPLETLKGKNSLTGEPFTTKYEPQIPKGVLAARAAESALENYIPGIRPAELLAKQGGKENPASLNPIATKPGTQTGLLPAFAKEFSPVPFIAERSKGRERGAARERGNLRERGGGARERGALRERH